MHPAQKTSGTAFNCPNCGAAATPDSIRCPYCHSSIAARVCPSCFGAVAVGMEHCPSCGAETGGGSPAETTAFRCPRCRKELSLVTAHGHKLHECLQCGGLWVGAADFQEICSRQEDQEAVLGMPPGMDASEKPAAQIVQRTYVPCPECGKLMNRKNFAGCSGIVLDWCREHGCWFDRRELQEIIIFIRNGGLQKSRERELARIQDERLRLRAQQYNMNKLASMAGVENPVGLESVQERDPFVRALSFLFGDMSAYK